jgi:2-dehydropantoate 2-reductase
VSAPSVTIVGAGAIGGWLAWLLDRAGWDVRLLTRGAALAAIRDHGLRIEAAGETAAVRARVSDDPAELGPSDYLVIALKGQQLPPLAASLGPLLGPQTAVVTAMNGLQWWFTEKLAGPLENSVLERVDPGGALRRLIPVNRVIGAVVHATAEAPEPGRVRLIAADKLIFGEPDGRPSDRLAHLAAACRRADVTVEESANIRLAIWRKLWGNMSLNPVSALTRATTGALLDDPLTRDLVAAMMGEMTALGERLGLPMGMSVEDRMAVTARLGDFKTSMLRDLEAGRPLELAPLLGVLVEMAERLDQPAPHLRAVYALARRLDRSLHAAIN